MFNNIQRHLWLKLGLRHFGLRRFCTISVSAINQLDPCYSCSYSILLYNQFFGCVCLLSTVPVFLVSIVLLYLLLWAAKVPALPAVPPTVPTVLPALYQWYNLPFEHGLYHLYQWYSLPTVGLGSQGTDCTTNCTTCNTNGKVYQLWGWAARCER